MKPLVSVEHLTVRYQGTSALKEAQFDIFPSEVLGLIGANGSGKTTLMEGLVGLLPVSHRVVKAGDRTLKQSDLKRYFFYVPDGIRPHPHLRVSELLDFYSTIFESQDNKLPEILEALELQSVLNKRITELSKGYLRRFLLAIGFLSNQPILILDEPLDGFDVVQLKKIIPSLKSQLKGERTLFLCIHQLSDAERICDRFLLLKEGEILASGTKSELLKLARLETGSLEEVFLALSS